MIVQKIIDEVQFQWLSVMSYFYLQQHHFNSAISLLEAMAELKPNDYSTKKSLSYAYLRYGRYQDCLDLIEALFAQPLMADDRANYHLMRAHALWFQANAEESKSAMRKYLAILKANQDE